MCKKLVPTCFYGLPKPLFLEWTGDILNKLISAWTRSLITSINVRKQSSTFIMISSSGQFIIPLRSDNETFGRISLLWSLLSIEISFSWIHIRSENVILDYLIIEILIKEVDIRWRCKCQHIIGKYQSICILKISNPEVKPYLFSLFSSVQF